MTIEEIKNGSLTREQLHAEIQARDEQIEAIHAEAKEIRALANPHIQRANLEAMLKADPRLNQTVLHDASTFDHLVGNFGLDWIIKKVDELRGKQ